MSARRADERDLLLGEWACLGILVQAPAHGFAVAARLKPEGDIGRVWSLSRALTYRALDHLRERGLIRAVGEEPGIAGGSRTVLAPTRSGVALLRKWYGTPVAHLRDLRSELLLKLVLAEQNGADVGVLLERQQEQIRDMTTRILRQCSDSDEFDVVALWRIEAADAADRFLQRVRAAQT